MKVEISQGRQASKSRETRDKILHSTISLIREGGFSAASSKRIADRAGMTWGAAQHHFGSKEQILQAVIQVSHRKYLARLSDMSVDQGTIADRVSLLVDRMWEHYQDEVYLAAVEIIMAGRDLDPRATQIAAFETPSPDHAALMQRIFGDSGASESDLLEALIFTHCLLTGLTIQKMLEGEVDRLDRHLGRCKTMLEAMIVESTAGRS